MVVGAPGPPGSTPGGAEPARGGRYAEPVRLWVKESERRPDPAPARADGRKAAIAGIAAWLVALVATLVWRDSLTEADLGWWTTCCIIGTLIGVVGLIVVIARRRR